MARRDYFSKAGVPLPGVTDVIGKNLGWSVEALKYWAWDLGRQGIDYKKFRKKTADIGTVAHLMIEAELRGLIPELDEYDIDVVEAAKIPYAAFLDWKKGVGLEVVELEVKLVSEKLVCGGTADCVARLNCGTKPMLALIDWKTAKGFYGEQVIQAAAYEAMWNETHPEQPIEEVWIMRFGKDLPEFEHHGPIQRETVPRSKLPGLDDGLKLFRWLRGMHDVRCRMNGDPK